jgi:hypothetical protein
MYSARDDPDKWSTAANITSSSRSSRPVVPSMYSARDDPDKWSTAANITSSSRSSRPVVPTITIPGYSNHEKWRNGSLKFVTLNGVIFRVSNTRLSQAW